MTQTEPARRIEYIPITELTPDRRNPKGHQEDQIDASVARFGYIDPVVKDERTGLIISGHGRRDTLLAMKARGEAPPDGIHLNEAGNWLAPVVRGWSSRSDTEASAALIALNRSTELGGWVDEALLTLLDDLSASGENGLAGVGFDTRDIEELTRKLEAQAEWDPSDDALSPGERSAALDAAFRDEAGLDESDDLAYNPGYLAKVTIEMRDELAIEALRERLGLTRSPDAKVEANEEVGFVAVRWKRYRLLESQSAESGGQDHPTSSEIGPLRPSQGVDLSDSLDDEIDREARGIIA